MADVPWKATAGLHHPLRCQNDTVGAMEFGFLNVFLAGMLARSDENVTADDLTSLLTCDAADEFSFDETGVSWGSHRFDIDAIEDTRISFALSYGSCNFEDSWSDLRSLGLLPN